MSKISKKENTSELKPGEIPAEMEQALENLPENQRKVIRESIFMSMQGAIRPIDPITEHMDKEVLCKIIENAESTAKRESIDKQDARKYSLCVIVVFLLFLGIVLICFKDDIEGISKIITPLITALIGFAGGYGYGFTKGQS